MRKASVILFAVICVSLLLPACVVQQSSTASDERDRVRPQLDTILQSGVLRVGTTADFVPFSYRVAGHDDLFGVDIELARSLAAALDVEVRFVQTQWPSLMTDLQASRFDIGMSGITVTTSRKQHAYFSEPVMQSGKAAIARDENAARFRTLAAINQAHVRVIVNPGGTNEAFARANFPLATIILNEDNVSIFQKLVSGDADVMVTDAVETVMQELIHPELEAINPDDPFNQFAFAYLLPRDTAWKAFVDVWLKRQQEDGTLNCLFERELQRASAGNTAAMLAAC